MDCPTCEAMVDAYVDGELSASESADFELSLAACPECRRRLEMARAMSGLLRALPTEPAPDLLRARIERELHAIAGRPREPVRWAAMAASIVVALGIGWLGGVLSLQGGRETDELVAGYLRVALGAHAVDVASSDRHTVKPWFAGRLDFSPPTPDLAEVGFPLAGGRLDYLDGRTVAALIYRRRDHVINLFVWPDASAGAPTAPRQSDDGVGRNGGHAVLHWTQNGMTFWAVSDLGGAELADFARLFSDRAQDPAPPS
jgi:anti-sigma factor (TIGR02949 family)